MWYKNATEEAVKLYIWVVGERMLDFSGEITHETNYTIGFRTDHGAHIDIQVVEPIRYVLPARLDGRIPSLVDVTMSSDNDKAGIGAWRGHFRRFPDVLDIVVFQP